MIEQDVKILSNEKVAPGTYLMSFESGEISANSIPGQFLMIRVGHGLDPLLRRPFSICSIKEGDRVFILFRVVGKGTGYLARKKKHEKISVLGPLGQGFKIPEKGGKKIILLAGGIGIAPLIFLAQKLKEKDFEFMAGYSSSMEIIDTTRIVELPKDISLATDDGSMGFSGQVTKLLDEYIKQHPGETEELSIFACGPVPMLSKLAAMASDNHISCQVSFESLMACGVGACQGCAVRACNEEVERRYKYVCKDGPVFQVQTIDWSLI